MSIYKSAVNKPITTLMVFTAVVVMGIYTYINIPVDLYPELDPPYISVLTTYPGANALDIESNVTRTLEDAFNTIDGVKEVTSVSSDNLSVITLEFSWEANLDEATNEIRDVIDRIYRFLPEGVDRPSIFKFNTNMMPIVFYAVTAKESYAGLDKILEEKIINPLNRIEGVGSVGMIGVPKRMVYVDIDPQRLDAYHMTIEQIGNSIAAENMNMPAGNIKMGLGDYQLRVQGEYSDSRDLQYLVVGNYNGKLVYLSDVASVNDTLKDLSIEERISGERGLRMFIMKQSGANTIQVARDARNMVDALKKDLPADIQIRMIMDTSVFISDSISNLSKTLLYALLFVILVVLVFLGKWRATFIVVVTIPISLIVSFIYLFITGNSINVISLTSLSIAIGMVVDDAIVVLENISKHIERGSSPREAAIYATNEVWLAVIVTTLVVVAVFFPLTLIGGMTGVLFKQLGWIVTITVSTSTLAAITLTPTLASRLLKMRPKKDKPKAWSFERTLEPLFGRVESFYVKTLGWALSHKLFVSLLAIAVFAGSLFLTRFIGTDFMPEADQSRITATIELQTGTRMEESSRIARQIEAIIFESYPEVEVMAVSAGADDEGSMFSVFATPGTNIINMMMRLVPIGERERSVWEIAESLRSQVVQFPEVITANFDLGGAGMGGTTNTVDIEVYGYDFDATNRLAWTIHNKVSQIEGATDLAVSRKADKPELQLVLDREKMALHGLNTAMVSGMVRNRISGMTASYLKEEGNEFEIRVRLGEQFRSSITQLEGLSIVNPMGQRIRLGEIGKVEEYWGPPAIQHKRKERIVTVSAKPSGTSLGQLAAGINQALEEIEIPDGVAVVVAGAFQEQQEAFADLALLMLVSLILVFIVMASQFESFVMPFVIMFSIPFAFTGVILALLITGTTLSVIAALGAVLLIGIVVKNGIVLIDFTNLMRDREMKLNEAILTAGKSRLRPVLMTATTTMLAMLPLALSTGEGSEIWSPMGITIIGGLVFSTIVTMILVPVMYAVFARRGERDKQSKYRKDLQFLE